MKICATTLGETAGDLLSMTLKVGYAMSSIILINVFLITLIVQLNSNKHHPLLYWAVIISTSTAGTTMSDYMDRTLALGYMNGSIILLASLLVILAFWRLTVRDLSVVNIKTTKVEMLYWSAILFSNTLGTALGDFLADDSGLGFGGGALLISSLIGLVVIAHFYSNISKILLFWIAFILTRPLGATVGDLLTKAHDKGGFDLGTIGSSAVLLIILGIFVVHSIRKQRKTEIAAIAPDFELLESEMEGRG
jgi:uncharacterized membrane-anchored protein